MKPKVLVTKPLPGLDRLQSIYDVAEVVVNARDRDMTKEELIQELQDCSAVICMLSDKFDAEVMAAAPQLKVIANYAVGFDNIDIPEATRRGIYVTNTPDVLTDATADLAWSLLLSVTRRILEGDALMRAGRFEGWQPDLMLGSQVSGKTLGIIGMGRIGQAVARRALGFGMKVIYYNRHQLPAAVEQELHAEYVSLEELISHADYISLNCPYNKESHHMFQRETFRSMKKSAYLINTARGALIHEEALVEALKSGEIAGAGLDVYEFEPEMHAGLKPLSNVVLAPHVGSATHDTREIMCQLAVGNVLAALQDQRPKTLVNPEVSGK